MRDITLEDTIDFKFTTTEPDTGAPATLSGTPVISAYVGNSTTQITAGITLSVDFDGVTGLNNVRVAATAANGYTTATDVALIITTGTVDAVSAVGYKVAEFTIGRGASLALRPTTAGRTLDVASTGEAGVDFDNILFSGNGPFAPLGIIDRGTAQAADAYGITLRAGFSTAAANMVGKSVWVYSSTNGLHATGLSTAYDNTTKVLTVSGLGEAPTGTVLYVVFATANGSTAAIADAVWDEATSGHTTSGTFGEQVKTDIDAILVDTDVIGTTGQGLTTLATQASVNTIDDFLDTEIAAILALLDDPRGEPGQGAPPVNPDLATKIDWLYKAWRNRKTQTATEFALYADDGTTKDQESAVSSDGTTLVIGEMATGA